MTKNQPEEYDVLALAKTVKPKKEAGKVTKIITIITVSSVILGLFGYGLSQWFKPTDFTGTVALSEDISRFSPLEWVTPENTLENNYGSWVRDNETAPYVNSDLGCSILLADLKGASAEAGSDLEDTQLYTRIFNQPANINISTVEDYVPVNETGKVEMLRTTYTNVDETKHYLTYYRNTIKNETVYLAVLECDSKDSYDKVIASNTIAEDLNIRFKG